MGKQSKNKAPKTAAAPAKPGKGAAPATATKTKGPPFTISVSEYHDLVEQVRGLTLEEIQEEWILAARYGDLDVMHAIMTASQHYQHNPSQVIHAQDDSTGNAALHMAAANGHTSVVALLLDLTALTAKDTVVVVNHSGNTPLHWAAANGQEHTVQLLVQRLPDLDVLQKNKFGRSALTEGFSSQNTNVVKYLLEHDSAAEEKLLMGATPVEEDEEEEKENAAKQETPKQSQPQTQEGMIHEFHFLVPPDHNNNNNHQNYLKIRELPIPATQDCFGDRPELDTTGYGIWAASIVMARWMAQQMAPKFKGKRLLELGAGCGVPGLAAAFYSDATKVFLTDVNPTTLDNLHYNIALNNNNHDDNSTQKQQQPASWNDRLHAMPINWEDPNTWPKEKIDYIIGSDLIYQESIVPILKTVILGLCQGQGTFLYVAPDTASEIGRDGLAEFIQEMKETDGCELIREEMAPKDYHANPLANQDDDLFFLHFHELTSASYRLYEFQINTTTSTTTSTTTTGGAE
ncbi:EEF1A lysine methyltransferase 3 [Seminavis robusta]|uniref:EEF1A lysine methyltransferase 3 n=1 Tax=Seminavis robusta TaxID=568900 RepID=A0A9N8H401_9STRA|nr:EEF1A lysine methyltransferase 3 [Seminavis robusta]|eukprot:Sro2_g001890.1 EEF1A lysine methyltransferase 3 (517) ;mRNA; r:269200-270867